MKYTICSFQQAKLIKYGLDDRDALIIQYILDFYHTNGMKKHRFDDKDYFWVSYGSIQREFPIFGYKERKTVERRFKRYTKCGLLHHKTLRRGGVFSYFRFDPDVLADLLTYDTVCIQDENKTDEKDTPRDFEVPRVGTSESQGIGLESPYKDSSTSDPSTNDPSTKSLNVINGGLSEKTITHCVYDYFDYDECNIKNIQTACKELLAVERSSTFYNSYLSNFPIYAAHYFEKYQDTFEEQHPPIKKEYWPGIINRIITWTSEDFIIEIIDQYFSTELDCDYNIIHFSQENILLNRQYDAQII